MKYLVVKKVEKGYTQCCVLSVNDLCVGTPLLSTLQKVAHMLTTLRNELENFSNDVLLLGLISNKVIEVNQARFAVVIDDKDGLYHYAEFVSARA